MNHRRAAWVFLAHCIQMCMRWKKKNQKKPRSGGGGGEGESCLMGSSAEFGFVHSYANIPVVFDAAAKEPIKFGIIKECGLFPRGFLFTINCY